jgi:hypothetical protein
VHYFVLPWKCTTLYFLYVSSYDMHASSSSEKHLVQTEAPAAEFFPGMQSVHTEVPEVRTERGHPCQLWYDAGFLLFSNQVSPWLQLAHAVLNNAHHQRRRDTCKECGGASICQHIVEGASSPTGGHLHVCVSGPCGCPRYRE